MLVVIVIGVVGVVGLYVVEGLVHVVCFWALVLFVRLDMLVNVQVVFVRGTLLGVLVDRVLTSV